MIRNFKVRLVPLSLHPSSRSPVLHDLPEQNTIPFKRILLYVDAMMYGLERLEDLSLRLKRQRRPGQKQTVAQSASPPI